MGKRRRDLKALLRYHELGILKTVPMPHGIIRAAWKGKLREVKLAVQRYTDRTQEDFGLHVLACFRPVTASQGEGKDAAGSLRTGRRTSTKHMRRSKDSTAVSVLEFSAAARMRSVLAQLLPSQHVQAASDTSCASLEASLELLLVKIIFSLP